MSPAPVVSAFTTEVYEHQHMFAANDANEGYSLLLLTQALTAPFVEVDDIVRDSDDGVGWSALFDPDRCPVDKLGYLAQFVGVRLLAGLSEAEQRARVKGTDGFKRGSLGAVTAAAKQFLTGTKFVLIKERYDIDNPTLDSPYYLYIATKPSETPDYAAALAAIIAQKPAGIILRYTVTGATDSYEGLAAYQVSYQTVFDGYATYGAIQPAPTYYDGLGQKYATYTAAIGAGTYNTPT